MLVAVFNSQTQAYKGLDALKDLHQKGDITLYAVAVVSKDMDGKVSVKQAADEGPVGTAVGMLTGALVGSLAGPVGTATGVAAGASAGGLTGLLFDLGSAGVNADFLDEVSDILIPDNTAIVAEIDEDWVTPVDTKLEALGGQIFRQPRYEVIDDQLAGESAAFNAEMKELQKEIKASNGEAKASVKKTLDSVKTRLKSIDAKAHAKLDEINSEAEAKRKALQAQMKNAHEERKAKLEKRIAEIKADQRVRSEKLHQASMLARQALTP